MIKEQSFFPLGLPLQLIEERPFAWGLFSCAKSCVVTVLFRGFAVLILRQMS